MIKIISTTNYKMCTLLNIMESSVAVKKQTKDDDTNLKQLYCEYNAISGFLVNILVVHNILSLSPESGTSQ